MTQEEKSILLQDLCARLPFKVKVKVYEVSYPVEFDVQMLAEIKNNNWYEYPIPYLRPMSSMTGVEVLEYISLKESIVANDNITYSFETYKSIDWLNAHHFDYRGLIEKGLAIEVTKENNPYEN